MKSLIKLVVLIFFIAPAANAQTWKTLLREDFGAPSDGTLPVFAPINTLPADQIFPGSSDYTPRTANSVNDGQYAVATNPNLVDDFGSGFNNQWINAGDHTTGSGYMMIINANIGKLGETAGTYYVFSTNAFDVPGANYRISLWSANILGNAGNGTPAADAKDGYVGLAIRDNAAGTGILYNAASTRIWQLPRKTPFTRSAPLPWQNLTSTFSLPVNYSASALYFNFYNWDPGAGNSGNDLALDDIVIQMQVVQFSGTVFNDKDGDGAIDAGELSVSTATNGQPLYAYITKSNGAIVSKVQVQPDGTYTFFGDQGMPYSTANIGLKIVISSQDVALGGNITTSSIVGYGTVSESGSPEVGPGANNKDGVFDVLNSTADVSNVNVGINHTPVAEVIPYTLSSQPAVNTVVPLNGTGAPLLRGSDAEDQPTTGPLTTKTIRITSLPTNGQLLYQGNPVQFGADGLNPPSPTNPFVITSLTASDLSVQLTGSGYTSTSFNYSYVDATGLVSPPAAYTINFASVLPVVFGEVSATVNDGVLTVNFSCVSEKNNAYFVVEGSVDGKDFKEIGRLNSTAPSGSSDASISYSFTQTIQGALSLGALFGVGLFGALLFGGKRNRKMLGAAMIISSIIFVSCNKAKDGIDNGDNNIYIRIVQVDIDGAKTYSEVVKAVIK